jgi:integrase
LKLNQELVNDEWEIIDGEKRRKSMDQLPKYYYDFDLKNQFAKTYPSKETSRVVMALFRNTEEFETLYGKDLYDFDYEELSGLLKSFKATTLRSLQNQVSMIDRYTEFAKKQREFLLKENYAKGFVNKEILNDLLDKEAEENMILNRDTIMEMALSSDNAQDGVLLGLLFDGVSHKNEFEELTTLTIDKIDFDKKLINLDGRTIPISPETKKLIEGSLDQERKYISTYGNSIRNYTIAEGNNVLRGLRGKNIVKGQIVSQRILRIAELNDYEYLNATTVSYSGQLHYAKQLIEKENNTVENAIDKILHRFGIPINTSSQFYLKGRIEKHLEQLSVPVQ